MYHQVFAILNHWFKERILEMIDLKEKIHKLEGSR